MKRLIGTLACAALGYSSALVAANGQTQVETLTGTIVPGNDQDFPVLIFDANNIFTVAYLPVEQEAGNGSFSLGVVVPVGQAVTGYVTILSVYGGNGGTNDSPVSAVMNSAAAARASTTAAANGMNGPLTFATTFGGASEVGIFNDLEAPSLTPAVLGDLESFVSANASQFVTFTGGNGVGSVQAFSQINPGVATFQLAVPEPASSRTLLVGAGLLALLGALRGRRPGARGGRPERS